MSFLSSCSSESEVAQWTCWGGAQLASLRAFPTCLKVSMDRRGRLAVGGFYDTLSTPRAADDLQKVCMQHA